MSKKSLITILGSIVIILPFLGLPKSISTPIFAVLGIGIIYIARSGGKKKVKISSPVN